MNTDLPRDLQRKRALKRLGSFVLLASMIALVLAPMVIAGFSSEGVTIRDQYASILLAATFFVGSFIAVHSRKIRKPRTHQKAPINRNSRPDPDPPLDKLDITACRQTD